MDTLTSIRVFCSVVELKSFVAAARRLRLSPAMASKHLMRLEQRLGTRLLNRTSRHLSLTEAGTYYFEQSRQMLDALEDMESTVTDATILPRGTLKLSAPVWLANPLFVSLLADYRTRYPDVRLDIDLSGRLVNLVEEGFDLALRVARSPSEALIARPLARIVFHLVAAPAYLHRAGRPQRSTELADHAVLFHSLIPMGGGLSFQGPHGHESVNFTPALLSNNESLLHLAALQGMGLALLPEWLVAHDLEEGRLARVLPDHQLPEMQLLGVYPSRKHLSSKVRTFLDFVTHDERLNKPLAEPVR